MHARTYVPMALKRLVFAVFVVAFGLPGVATEFSRLPTEEPPSTMAMTEDGAVLLVAHESAGQVTIWDTRRGEKIASLDCENPRHILCRGSKAFVANHGAGTITVLSERNGTWTISDQLLAGNENVYYLTAPGGSHFKNELIASTGKYTDHEFLLIDARRDKHRRLEKQVYASVATASYDGQHLVMQGEFSHSPSATARSYVYADFVDPKGNRDSKGGDHAPTPLLFQVGKGSFWFGDNQIYSGIPPRPFGKPFGARIVPDLTREVFYVLEEAGNGSARLEARTLNSTLSALGSIAVAAPEPVLDRRKRGGNYTFYTDAAATLDGMIYLYVMDPKDRTVYRCAVKDFIGAATEPSGGDLAADESLESPEGGEAEFPARIAEGAALSYSLPGGVSGSYTLLDGPTGMTVSNTGRITWTPAGKDVGEHDVKIKTEVDGKVTFHRFAIEVMAKEVVAAAGGDIADIDALGEHFISHDRYSLEYAHSMHAILLLSGNSLAVLDAHGQRARATFELGKSYLKILDRPGYCVALFTGGLDLLDKKTMRVLKSIPLPGAAASDFDLHPVGTVAYVAAYNDMGGQRNKIDAKRIYQVDEKTGEIHPIPQLVGDWVRIDATGRYLVTAFAEMFREGYRIDWHIGGIMPSYGNIDVLIGSTIARDGVQPEHTNLAPGANGKALRIAPDGKNIAYVSGGGLRSGPKHLVGYTIPAFPTNDIRTAQVSYRVDAYPVDVSFHPMLPLVAGTNGKELRIFQRDSGEVVADKVRLPEGIKDIKRLLFSAGGQHLLVDCQDASSRRALRSLPLRLDVQERQIVARGFQRPKAAPATTLIKTKVESEGRVTVGRGEPVRKNDLNALQPGGRRILSTQEIARKHIPAVAVVLGDEGSGSGFFVGEKGYVLTCAHVLPRIGNPTVSYRTGPHAERAQKVAATVLAVDRRHDLALLKIPVREKVPTVRLESRKAPATGEEVSIIGHPGLGMAILDYTMTQGIISNPARPIDGIPYLQTNATVNPGASGGPMFDSHGNVIGLVVLKAGIEGVGFAVPAERIAAFLEKVVAESEKD